MVAAAERLYTTGPIVSRTLQRLRPHIAPFHRLVPLVPPGSRVLDVGCGAGLFLGLLASHGRLTHGVGFDTSARAIALAGSMAARTPAPERLSFLRRDVGEDWPDGQFDVVSLIDVLHHVPPAAQRALLTEAASRVARGGLLLYKDVTDAPRWQGWVSRLHDLVVVREWIHFLPFTEVVATLEAAGLTLERFERIDMLGYAHELGAFRRSESDDQRVR